jgi:hypothetical protein
VQTQSNKYFQMQIPSLPTDNIYKFSTIGGLFLLVFVYYYSLIQTEKLMSEQFELASEKKTLSVQVNYFNALYQDAMQQKLSKLSDTNGVILPYNPNKDKEMRNKLEVLKRKLFQDGDTASYRKGINDLTKTAHR